MDELIQLVKKFMKEYDDYLEFDTYVKLWVLIWGRMKYQPKKIKQRLENHILPQISNGKNRSGTIAPYMRKDNKKISRIISHNKIQKLPYLIGIDNLVRMIIEKYPSPELTGFPYIKWTAELLHKYICLYFSINSNKKNLVANIPSITTLKSSLNKIKNNKKINDLDLLLQYYISKAEEIDFYYIYMKNHKYPVLNSDKQRSAKKLHYNSTYISSIFWLGRSSLVPYTDRILCTTYNSKNESIVLDYIFDFYYTLSHSDKFSHGKNPVFIIDTQSELCKDLLIDYFQGLTIIPPYQFIIINKKDAIMDSLDNLSQPYYRKAENELNLMQRIFDILEIEDSPAFTTNLESRLEKKTYIAKMVKTLTNEL
jgi:hypothetical protein